MSNILICAATAVLIGGVVAGVYWRTRRAGRRKPDDERGQR